MNAVVLDNDGNVATVQASDGNRVTFQRDQNAVSREQFLRDLPPGETLYGFERIPIQ